VSQVISRCLILLFYHLFTMLPLARLSCTMQLENAATEVIHWWHSALTFISPTCSFQKQKGSKHQHCFSRLVLSTGGWAYSTIDIRDSTILYM